MNAPHPARPGRRAVVALIVIGAAATVSGVVFAFVAKSAAEQATIGTGTLTTLPVHVYAQYTQRGFVPDYAGLWIGLLVAAVGALVLAAGVTIARVRRSVV